VSGSRSRRTGEGEAATVETQGAGEVFNLSRFQSGLPAVKSLRIDLKLHLEACLRTGDRLESLSHSGRLESLSHSGAGYIGGYCSRT
jgi:hypothetical protein